MSTPQFRKRNAILECLRQTKQHPSAEALYQSLQRDYPDISLATVYRNLALFKQQGVILSLGTVNGVERFDGNVQPHNHFICQQCGCVLDLETEMLPNGLLAAVASETGCRIDGYQLNFTGKCENCLKKSN